MEKSAFSVRTNQHSLPSTTHFLPPTFLNLFSSDTAHSWRTAQNTVENFYFPKIYRKSWSRFPVFWDVIPFLSLPPQQRCVFHLLCSLFNQSSAEHGHSKCKEDICASLSHAKNSAKKKTELTPCQRNRFQSLKSFLERAGSLTSHFFSFFSLGFF